MSLLLTDNFWRFWIYIPHKYYAWLLPFKGNKIRRSKPDIFRISETRPVVIEDVTLTVNGSFFCLSVISKQKLEWPESYLLFLQTTKVCYVWRWCPWPCVTWILCIFSSEGNPIFARFWHVLETTISSTV